MLVAHLADAQPGETVADVCAAPGTKTTHLGQLMGNRGRILAFDRDPQRLASVREAAARLGITIVETREGPVEALALEHAASCDVVLVDAPCSNLGVLRRHPEVKWRRQPADLAASAASQRAILRAAAGMVKPGGRLVYATCSLEPEENDAVVRDLLERLRRLRRRHARRVPGRAGRLRIRALPPAPPRDRRLHRRARCAGRRDRRRLAPAL